MHAVLLIDDDEALGDVLREYVAGFSIALEQALLPEAGLAAVATGRFEAVVLDVMLPGMTGFDVLRRLRAAHDVPVLMLSARGEVTDRIVGLELGADDYLPKPFEPRELVARLLANLRRPAHDVAAPTGSRPALAATGSAGPVPVAGAGSVPEAVRRFERLSVDTLAREALVDGTAAGLTTKEFELVALLSGEPGRSFSRDAILAVLKGTEHELFTRSVDILVSRVRAKLRPLAPIRTLHGAGYAFVVPRVPPP